METIWPDSHIDVIEIDPGVTDVAYDHLGLSRETNIRSFNEDARQFLMQEPTVRYDLVFGDAFNDFSVPWHLTTNEFNQLVANHLEPDGLYIVNMIDGGKADFLRAYVHTLQQTFAYVHISPTIDSWRESPHSTFVILASNEPVSLSAIGSVAVPGGTLEFSRRVLNSAELTTLLTESTPILLTDRYAPVEQMLLPAFRDEVNGQ